MKVLVLGSGGREHALAWKIAKSPLVTRVFAAPGNGGTERCGENLVLDPLDARAVYRFVKQNGIDLTVIGGEAPLEAGVADVLADAKLRVFGPSRRAARLETSKVFAKSLMRHQAIPTAEFKVFQAIDEAEAYLEEAFYPVVVKADGLAAGKGVFVCSTREEACQAVYGLLVEKRFGDAGAKVVIEEALTGPEVSVLAICGDETVLVLEDACDYKRLRDGNQGPNTGGMGAYSPSGLLDDATQRTIERKIIVSALHGLAREGCPFRGVLYAGVMLTPTGPRVLEYNVRLGDPEAQAILPRLQSDLVPLLLGVTDGNLAEQDVRWDERASVTVVMASAGYPEKPRLDATIEGIPAAELLDDVTVFHAGTRRVKDGRLLSAGGRVLAVTALGATREAARQRAYEAVKRIRLEGAVWRTDIGATRPPKPPAVNETSPAT